MSIFIRYTDLEHSEDIIKDYINMGKYFYYPDISEIGEYKANNITIPGKYNIIYCCPSLPCIKTAEILQKRYNANLIIKDDLRNIWHDFSAIYKGNLPSTREAFYKDFANNRLLEDKTEIIGRIQRILSFAESNNAIYITHGILLSLIKLEKNYGLGQLSGEEIMTHIDSNKEIASSMYYYEI